MVLEFTLFVKEPGSVEIPTLKCFALLIPETSYIPLNPVDAAPVGLFVLRILFSSTLEPRERLCGSSVRIFAVFELQFASAINLKFLCEFTFEIDPLPK